MASKHNEVGHAEYQCDHCGAVLNTEQRSLPLIRRVFGREGWLEHWPSANGMYGIKQHYCADCAHIPFARAAA
jgi:hypothetical protein